MATLVSDPHGVDGVPGGAAERDAALAEGLHAGRREAFEQLYELYRGRIYNLTLRIVQSPEDACDITHDVFVKAFRKLPDSPVTGLHLTPWLYRVALNASYDHLRTRRVHRHIDDVGADRRPAPVDTFEQAEMGRLVEESLAALSARHRAVLVLKDIHGLRHGEIAEILGVSRGATETLLHRARRAFRAAYLDLTHDAPRSRTAEKWSAAGVGIGVVLHEVPLPAALQGGFPFAAAGGAWAGAAAGAGAAGGAAGATAVAGVAAGGAGTAGGSSAGLTLAAGGLLAKAGGAVSVKIAAAVIAASCAAGGGVAAYEAGTLHGTRDKVPDTAQVHTPATAGPKKAGADTAGKRGKAAPAPVVAAGAATGRRAAARQVGRAKQGDRGATGGASARSQESAHGKTAVKSHVGKGAARTERGKPATAKGATTVNQSGRSAVSAGQPDQPGGPGQPDKRGETD